jgi:hypothetical protein
MNRFDSAGSSGRSLGLRGIPYPNTYFMFRVATQRAQNSAQVSGLGFRATSRSIGQPLALCADQRAIGASQIIHAKRDPIVVPKIEFRQDEPRRPL